jgi:hypothetical protein
VTRWIVLANVALAAVFAGLGGYIGAKGFPDDLCAAPLGVVVGIALYAVWFMPK